MSENSLLWGARLRGAGVALVLALALAAMGAGAVFRGTEYDENYTVFLAAGTPRPAWPAGVFTPAEVRSFFHGHSTAAGIARDLRATDVHPPLYFWAAAAWRGVAGSSLLVTRLASVLFSLGALLCVGGIAASTGVPPVATMLLTLGCYGFAYTGLVARGFALAQLLALGGILLLLRALREGEWPAALGKWPAALGGWPAALGGGLLLGLASFTNYLTAFVAAAVLLWLLLERPRRVDVWLVAGLGFAALLPADLWFFVAQRNSRVGQFPPFELLPAIRRLAEYAVANVFGGLPLYVEGTARLVVGAAVAALFLLVVGIILRRPGNLRGALLPVLGLCAMPAGLIVLGFVFDNTPIELRYLAFSMPFFGLLAARAFAGLGRWRLPVVLLVGLVQTASLLGMITRPETMQPQRQAAREAASAVGAGGVVLLPRGNDGVGVVAAFISEAPDDLRLLLVDGSVQPAGLRQVSAAYPRIVLAELGLDADSKAELAVMHAAFADAPCWRRRPAEPAITVYDRTCAPAQTENFAK